MQKDEWKLLDEQRRKAIEKCQIPERDELLKTLCALIPITGNLNDMFCNMFLMESVELLKHAFYLYEDGYFDCAFYSLRQSIENINNMLLVSIDHDTYELWKKKGRFPSDKQVKELLNQKSDAYGEIKAAIPEFYEEYDKLLRKSNKYIHKQGFDTFYTYKYSLCPKDIEERTNLFVSFLKYGIGVLLVINIVLDPLSLALSDAEINSYIAFEPLTMPIPLHVFEKFLSIDIIDKIKTTSYYLSFRENFLRGEKLNDATCAVIRYNYYDVGKLSEIEQQIQLLDLPQVLMFCILKSGIKVTYFYWNDCAWAYQTSYQPRMQLHENLSKQFCEYLINSGEENYSWDGMYMNGFRVFDSNLIIQHNDPLLTNEIKEIKCVIEVANQKYHEDMKDLEELIG